MKYDDALGEEISTFGQKEISQLVTNEDWIIVRLNLRTFSHFSSCTGKPFDQRFSQTMKQTTKFLFEEFKPVLSYTHSDEINLLFRSDNASLGDDLITTTAACAGKASAIFAIEMHKHEPEIIEKHLPSFNGVAQGASPEIAASYFLWREQKARKDAVILVALNKFSQTEVNGKSPDVINEMLVSRGINYHEDYPSSFRRGTIIRKRKVKMPLTETELSKIPEKFREQKRGQTFSRSQIVEIEDHPPLHEIHHCRQAIMTY